MSRTRPVRGETRRESASGREASTAPPSRRTDPPSYPTRGPPSPTFPRSNRVDPSWNRSQATRRPPSPSLVGTPIGPPGCDQEFLGCGASHLVGWVWTQLFRAVPGSRPAHDRPRLTAGSRPSLRGLPVSPAARLPKNPRSHPPASEGAPSLDFGRRDGNISLTQLSKIKSTSRSGGIGRRASLRG
jgi:hypothetical protein